MVRVRKSRPNLAAIPSVELLRDALNLTWKFAEGQLTEVDQLKNVYLAFDSSVSISEDTPEHIVLCAAAAGCPPAIILKPHLAVKRAETAANCVMNLLEAFYADSEGLLAYELGWQLKALDILTHRGERPLNRELFAGIEECERGELN